MSTARRQRPLLRAIVGPTAAGKSGLALAVAKHVGASIISADSRQVFRHFDIGTAKPSAAERAEVTHAGVDIIDPTERISADAWARQVPSWIADVRAQNREPLLVGGTGFYLRALFDPLFDAPSVDEGRRQALTNQLEQLSGQELKRWCDQLDPARAHLGRTQLLRAIETALLTGQRLSTLHTTSRRAPEFAGRYLLVDPGRVLGDRITGRVHQMLAAGWMDEVQQLVRSVPDSAPAWSATGYSTLRAALSGEMALAAAIERVVIETRQYAKRQRTWFRHQLGTSNVTVVNPMDADALPRAIAWWHGDGV